MSFKTKMISKDLLSKLPDNVLFIDWVNQNDILGDHRIHTFITHGGTNSVSESLYHNKPMVFLGVTLDQINTAAVANKIKVGVIYNKREEITLENMIYGLEEILKPDDENVYLENSKEIGKLIRSNQDPREEFSYWIDYILRIGYKHLLFRSYIEHHPLQVQNYDVYAILIFLIFIIYLLLKKILVSLFCSCKASKQKIKTKI